MARQDKYELPNLMSQLRSLSELAESVTGDEVDWFIRQGDVSDDTGRMLRHMGLSETTMSEVAAARPMLKKRAETLAKRLEGVMDFIEDEGDLTPALTALDKIMVDLKDLRANLAKAAGREVKIQKKKEAEQKAMQQAVQQQQQAQDGGEDQGQQQAPQQPSQSKGEPTPSAADQAQAQAAAQRSGAQEDFFVIGGEVITEASGDDPFGFGPNFMKEVLERSGVKGE